MEEVVGRMGETEGEKVRGGEEAGELIIDILKGSIDWVKGRKHKAINQ